MPETEDALASGLLVNYDPADWYWIVGEDESRWWSSAQAAYVAPLPDWLEEPGNFVARIGSEAELSDLLDAAGLYGPDLKHTAATKRWRVETGGITILGAAIPTSRDDQAMITGAVAFAQLNPAASIDFKASSGWETLSSEQMIGIGQAVGAHVQACFAAEAAIDADIDAGIITMVSEIEVDERWPA